MALYPIHLDDLPVLDGSVKINSLYPLYLNDWAVLNGWVKIFLTKITVTIDPDFTSDQK